MSDKKSKIDWKCGDVAVIRKGWTDGGTELHVLGPAVFHRQWWVPIAYRETSDPDLFKEARLEKVVEEYIPTSLRKEEPKPRKLAFAIGPATGGSQLGMWHGPSPFEKDMLETEGRDDNSVIVRFNADGTDDVIWRWKTDRWISQ